MNCAYCHRSLISIDYVERLVGCLHLRAVTPETGLTTCC
jgi:hypothetical protein